MLDDILNKYSIDILTVISMLDDILHKQSINIFTV